MDPSLWQILWYLVVGASIVFYVILDGFDLGVGLLHLGVKKDRDRRIFLNAIGPVWDGNEVWLVVVIGALFAGFPEVYATGISAFYTLLMIFLTGIIFRAVAIEFRSKQPSPRWRRTWDLLFSLASAVIVFCIGIMLGNLIRGIPLNEEKEFIGGFLDFFSMYSVIVGMFTLSLFAMHGGIYLIMKTSGELQERLLKWIYPLILFFTLMYLLTTFVTFALEPHMIARLREHPFLLIFPLLSLLCIGNIPREVVKRREGRAFLFSSLSIFFFFILFAIGTYPVIIRSTLFPETRSLTLMDSSSPLTLKILLLIAGLGLPFVFAYGCYVYRIFRGKVTLSDTSY